MKRLFVAVDLSADARLTVARAQARLSAARGDALRLVRPEQLHVTLAFMAAVDEARVEAIARAIAGGFEQQAFRLAFGHPGALPSRARPRVLCLDVTEGAPDLVALQSTVVARLAEEGIEPDRRPFRPHLTLARFLEGTSADVDEILRAGSNIAVNQTVASATLYESQLSRSGATHMALARGSLTSAP